MDAGHPLHLLDETKEHVKWGLRKIYYMYMDYEQKIEKDEETIWLTFDCWLVSEFSSSERYENNLELLKPSLVILL